MCLLYVSYGMQCPLGLDCFCLVFNPDLGFLYLCGVAVKCPSISVRAMVSLLTRTPQVAVSIPRSKV